VPKAINNARLNEKERKIINSLFFLNSPIKYIELSKIMGMSKSTVLSYRRSALKKIKDVLIKISVPEI
jgi:DNA-directed RNA polymerase specialized sigma subunit